MYPLKIDAFCHIIPKKFKDIAVSGTRRADESEMLVALWDLDLRLRHLDRHPGLMQIIDLGSRGTRGIVNDRQKEIDMAKFANDEMAEIVFKHPDYFAAAVAALPLSDIDACCKEIDRAIRDLKFRGIRIPTPMNGKSLDSPELEPIYQKMCEYDLPILVHPVTVAEPNNVSRPVLRMPSLDWPHETADMMLRMTYSGMMQKYPNLKILTHHAGGGVPYYEQRLSSAPDLFEMVPGGPYWGLAKPPVEYLKKFYFDTATVGTAGLMCCRSFAGAEKMLFATDYPHDNQQGARSLRETINSVEGMEISDSEKQMIFSGNAKRIFKLPQ